MTSNRCPLHPSGRFHVHVIHAIRHIHTFWCLIIWSSRNKSAHRNRQFIHRFGIPSFPYSVQALFGVYPWAFLLKISSIHFLVPLFLPSHQFYATAWISRRASRDWFAHVSYSEGTNCEHSLGFIHTSNPVICWQNIFHFFWNVL